MSTAIFASAQGFLPLLGARVLWGIAWSGIWIGGNTIVLDIAQDHNRGLLSGRYQMWFFIGAGAAAMLGGLFTDLFGFRAGLWASAGLTGGGALIWSFWLPETRSRTRDSEIQRRPSPDRDFPWRVSLAASVPIFVIRFIFAGVIVSTTILWLAQFTGQDLQLGARLIPLATLTGSFSAMRAALSVLGAPLAGWSSDRIRDRWIVMTASFFVGAVGMWLMGSATAGPALAGAVLASLTAGAIQALAPALAGDRIRASQQGRGMAVMFTLGDLGSALGPAVALGLLTWIPLGSIYRMASVVLAASAMFALFGRRMDRR
jgi:MFS family permease